MSTTPAENAYLQHRAWVRRDELAAALEALPAAEGQDAMQAHRRLLEVSAYLKSLSTEPHLLITTTALSNLENALVQVRASLASWTSGSADAYLVEAAGTSLDAAIDIVARMPLAKDRLVKGTTAAAQAVIDGVLGQQTSLLSSVDTATTQLDTARSEFSESIQTVRDELAAVIATGETIGLDVAAQTERLETALTTWDETYKAELATRSKATTDEVAQLAASFAEKLEEQEAAAATQLEALQAKLDAAREKDKETAAEFIARLGKLESDAKATVEAIGGITTSGGYAEYAVAQGKSADHFRWAAVSVFGASFGLFLILLLKHKFDVANSTTLLSFKLGGTLPLLFAGGYLARESAQHRHEERRARSLELDLNALPAFIANLDDAAKKELQTLAAQRLFTQAPGAPAEGSAATVLDPAKLLQDLVTALGKRGT